VPVLALAQPRFVAHGALSMTRRLLVLNGLAAIAAVSHHALVWALTAMVWWAGRRDGAPVPNYDQIGGVQFYALRLVDQIAMAAVPAFLWVSGYFVSIAAGRQRGFAGWTGAMNRIKGLIPAYVLWSLVALALSTMDGVRVTLSSVAVSLVKGSAAPPFYYVPMLVQFYLMSPLLAYLAKHRWKALLIGTGCLQLAAIILRSLAVSRAFPVSQLWMFGPLVRWDPAAYIFWFTFGIVAGGQIGGFKSVLQRARKWVPAFLALTYALALVEWELLRYSSGRPWISGGVTLSDNLLAFALLIAFFTFDTRNARSDDVISRIGYMSYGIYLMHVPVLVVAAKGAYHATPVLVSYPFALYCWLIVAGVGLPAASMIVVNSSPLRRCYRFVFG